MKTIDRDLLIRKYIDTDIAKFNNSDVKIVLENLKQNILKMPTEDRPEGEWIIHFDDIWPEESTMECSVCHEEQPLEIDDNFCPNCGAKMKGSRR